VLNGSAWPRSTTDIAAMGHTATNIASTIPACQRRIKCSHLDTNSPSRYRRDRGRGVLGSPRQSLRQELRGPRCRGRMPLQARPARPQLRRPRPCGEALRPRDSSSALVLPCPLGRPYPSARPEAGAPPGVQGGSVGWARRGPASSTILARRRSAYYSRAAI
jgi:hypothetical protein